MSNDPWEQFGGPTNTGGFQSLEKDGDEIIGTIVRVGEHTPFADSGPCPRVFLKDDDGEEFHYDVTLTWLRNALLRERPALGTKVRFWRGPKKGQQVTAGLEILSGGAVTATVHNSGPKTKAKAASAPANDDLPPF